MEPIEVFFSYSHRDEKLRDKLALHLSMLQRQGIIKSWHDRKISAGMEWSKAIDDKLNSAKIILLLVSDHFLASDYCYDIEMQRAIARHEAGEALVIPIILKPVDWSGAPFGKLQAFPKDAKPVTRWTNRDEAFLNIAQGIRAAAKDFATPIKNKQPTVPLTPPLNSIPFDLEDLGGQVPLDSPFYIERPPIEERCYEAIAKVGALIRIKAPRQVGKSSLMIRILDHAIQRGYKATWLHLQSAGKQDLANLDSFLKWLCSRISHRLKLNDNVENYWNGPLSSNDKCTYYFEEHLLEELNTPLALCLDEIDELFRHEAIAGEFLGLLRSWHEESKINPLWRNLRLIITHSKEVYIPLNINQSPFNVGVSIELPPLNRGQIEDLIQRHGLTWQPQQVDQIVDLTGGHPYLSRVALYYIARGEITLEHLLDIAPTQEWVYGDHLRRQLGNLQEYPDLLSSMKQVIASNEPVRINPKDAFKLASIGLVRFQGNDVIPLCNLYRQYFKEMLEVI